MDDILRTDETPRVRGTDEENSRAFEIAEHPERPKLRDKTPRAASNPARLLSGGHQFAFQRGEAMRPRRTPCQAGCLSFVDRRAPDLPPLTNRQGSEASGERERVRDKHKEESASLRLAMSPPPPPTEERATWNRHRRTAQQSRGPRRRDREDAGNGRREGIRGHWTSTRSD